MLQAKQCYNFGMIEKHYETVKNICGDSIQLCIVTKKRTDEEILSYYEKGERIFGENHAQELKAKAERLPKDIRWQFIGHLQRNKVKDIISIADCIQSLDSLRLADAIEKEAAARNIRIDVLAEFHLAGEDTEKTGLDRKDAVPFIREVLKREHLNLCGIMVMGPHTDEAERIREVFTETRELFENLQKEFGADVIRTLSMGMSSDYEIAASCGSNMVRIGTYLFEE